MKTYIITRFSILDGESKSWKITRESMELESLKSILFSNNRLDEKFSAFENITYDSILSQTNKNFIWLIFISTHLPNQYKNRIYNFKKDNINIIEVNDMREFNKTLSNYKYGDEYTTVRLDDDDGLNPSFIENLNKAYNNSIEKNQVFSLVNGRKISIKNNQIYVERDAFMYKKIAIGLSKFNGNIYSCGNHTLVDMNHKIIFDESPNMFLIYSSNVCDTKRTFNYNTSIKINDVQEVFTNT